MPHGHTDSTKATAQNAATEEVAPNDQARDEHAATRAEPRSYTAAHVGDATLAAPAAGEVGDYAELDDPDLEDGGALGGGAQQGRTHNDREGHARDHGQGGKTVAANRALSRSGSPDQGTT
jgi:hypothetical protein